MRSVFRNLLGVGSAFLLAGVSAVFVASARSPLPERNAEDIYQDKCEVCHGKDGAGKTAKGKKVKVKDIRDTIGKMSEDEMIKVMNEGKGNDMESYKKEYTRDEIKALVKYYRGLAKK